MSAAVDRLPRRTATVILMISLVVGVAIGLIAGPEQQQLSEANSGDAELAQRVRDLTGDGDGLRSVVVAEVTPTSIRWAGLGNATEGRQPGAAPTDQTSYELGSVTKTFTGALLADAIKRGEVHADDTVDEHLPELRGTAAGGVTLVSLAQHRSGLPRLGATAQAAWPATVLNENGYATSTTEQLIADAAAAPVAPDQPPTYSNLGIALLGTALVKAADAPDYPTLLDRRITGPLGMTDTTIAATAAEVPTRALPGHTTNGLRTPRWTGTGYLPAGTSTFTTIEDLATWAQVQLNGKSPGIDALKPTADYVRGARIGFAWLVTPAPDGSSGTWHNGATAGSRSIVVLDRDDDRAVVMLGNAAVDLDPIAASLMHDNPPPAAETSAIAWVSTLLPIVLALSFGLVALRRAIRENAILPVIGALLTGVFGLLLLWSTGPWAIVGGWLWGIALAPMLAALAILAARARTLPLRAERRVWVAWFELLVGVGLVALGVAFW